MSDSSERAGDRTEVDAGQVRVVRVGHGANCSSIGSVVDTLFATAAVGAAVFAAVLSALRSEEVRVVGHGGAPPRDDGNGDGDAKARAREAK